MSTSRISRRALAVLGSLAVSLSALAVVPAPAHADGPGVGTPYVVSVGESYISGEAGRWAGNTNQGSYKHDALGSTAYFDNEAGTGETYQRCHRSRSADIHIGGVLSKNLACSGAKTTTYTSDDGYLKPGIDFFDNGSVRGQALDLQNFAKTHNVTMVEVSIGGNDFGFGDTIVACMSNWATSPSWWKNYCYDDAAVQARVSSSSVTTRRNEIAQAFANVRAAMRNAGYGDSSWTLLVRNYMSPLPRGAGIRYAETGYTRYDLGGCGIWNKDADWANDVYLSTINSTIDQARVQSGLTNTRTLNVATLFNGNRLCETGVGLLEEKGLDTWRSPGAVDQTEWVNTTRVGTTCCANSPYYIQESFHPNYWGQLALRGCVRAAWNGGAVRSGTCVQGASGLTASGEPKVVLQ
ncbi:SGNH/GDSL hydrolase family protein [Nocardioides allogilvus]|uniref:hypothetical protein n=1 Tax=Nocardioides allogilvus TaxID=2072017 RepID=UPI001E30D5CD|nr:hypothetical protein [Nocardioides allogilvus]